MDKFIGKVVNVNDPERAGRLQIRIFGLHDDVSNIPDEDLPWARCIFPITNPVSNGVAGPVTGAVVGTTVVGYFVDENKQIPVVEGTLGKNAEKSRDFPKPITGEDFNEVLKTNVLTVGITDIKYLKERTIGSIKYTGQSINSLVKSIEDSDMLEALSRLQELRRQLQSLKSDLVDAPLSEINSLISKFSRGINIDIAEISVLTNLEGLVFNNEYIKTIAENNRLEYDTIQHLVGSISSISKEIKSADYAINRVSGLNFTMNGSMSQVENTFNTIKSLAKKKISER